MTILFITHYPGFYGANKSLLTLMLLLRERHDISPLVLLPSKGPICSKLEEVGIPYKVSHYYWCVNYNSGLFQWLLNKRKQWKNLLRVKKICRLFSDIHIDLIYSNSICVNTGFLMAKRMGLPHIWHIRESLDHYGFRFSLQEETTRRMLNSNTNKKYILISNFLEGYYNKWLPDNRIIKVYNGVSLPDGTYRRNENKIDGRLQIACIGVLYKEKNQMELLKAQDILHKRGIEIETWLIGHSKEDYLRELQKFAEQNGIAQNVHFTGHCDDVFSILQDINLGVVTSRYEAFGRTTIEFMLMRMPVIADDSGANTELIASGVTGDIYQSGKPEQLADKIEYYVNNPELLEIRGKAAEQSARENFSAERNAEQIYQQIVEATRC